MKKLIVITLFLLSTTLAQWAPINNISLFSYGSCIDAFGENFVVFAAYQKLLITQDAGRTWIEKPFKLSHIIDLSVVDQNVFYIACDNGGFYKTINAGDSWIEVYHKSSRSEYANYIEMFSPTEGIGMGDSMYPSTVPLFIKTTDGINWVETCSQAIGGGAADGWLGVDFVNSNIGYYSPKGGPAPRNLHKTTDGGYTWIKTDFEIYADVLKFYDKDYGILAKWPFIYRTTTGGVNWTENKINATGVVHIQDIEFVSDNPNKIWISYSGGLFFSNDSGKTWIKPNLPVLQQALDIKFTSLKSGWLLCQTNGIYYTNNNGGVSTSTINHGVPTDFQLYQNYPNPFNPETVISYQLPVAGYVALKVYDVLGKEVATLVDEFKQPGNYNSQLSILNCQLTSGVYFYRLKSGNYIETKKMLVIK